MSTTTYFFMEKFRKISNCRLKNLPYLELASTIDFHGEIKMTYLDTLLM